MFRKVTIALVAAAMLAPDIVSARGGGGVRCGDSEGGGLPFALLLRGLDWSGGGADFEIGILQGGEGQTIVAISL